MSNRDKCPRCDASASGASESGLRRYICGSFEEREDDGPFGYVIKLRQSEACSWHPNWIRRKNEMREKEAQP